MRTIVKQCHMGLKDLDNINKYNTRNLKGGTRTPIQNSVSIKSWVVGYQTLQLQVNEINTYKNIHPIVHPNL